MLLGEAKRKQKETSKILYPHVYEIMTPIPRRWSSNAKSGAMTLSRRNLQARRDVSDPESPLPAIVRTAYPIPFQCGLYYFEVEVMSHRSEVKLDVGLTLPITHGGSLSDDDFKYEGPSPWGIFESGDIVGCGVNFYQQRIFYTKNGSFVYDYAFENMPLLFPTVGIYQCENAIIANFGRKDDFKFANIRYIMLMMRNHYGSSYIETPIFSTAQVDYLNWFQKHFYEWFLDVEVFDDADDEDDEDDEDESKAKSVDDLEESDKNELGCLPAHFDATFKVMRGIIQILDEDDAEFEVKYDRTLELKREAEMETETETETETDTTASGDTTDGTESDHSEDSKEILSTDAVIVELPSDPIG